jgi:hypothetical protein
VNWLQRLNNYWQGLMPRERYYAMAAAGMIVLFIAFLTVRSARATMNRLDSSLARLQDNLGVYERLVAEREAVEAQFSRVAAQHSSKWTEPEILDRLRQEIYRLAQKEPPALDERGVPLSSTSTSGHLVEIPALGQGRLNEGQEGYREYSITFTVPPAPLENMMAFLQRLQNSPQSLRIDGLELVRPHHETSVSAIVDLTRIIVDGMPEGTADEG